MTISLNVSVNSLGSVCSALGVAGNSRAGEFVTDRGLCEKGEFLHLPPPSLPFSPLLDLAGLTLTLSLCGDILQEKSIDGNKHGSYKLPKKVEKNTQFTQRNAGHQPTARVPTVSQQRVSFTFLVTRNLIGRFLPRVCTAHGTADNPYCDFILSV